MKKLNQILTVGLFVCALCFAASAQTETVKGGDGNSSKKLKKAQEVLIQTLKLQCAKTETDRSQNQFNQAIKVPEVEEDVQHSLITTPATIFIAMLMVH
jgi:hypothetical protein